MSKKQQAKTQREKSANILPRAKYPRHSVEKALRVPQAILDQNAGKPVTPSDAASLLGLGTAAGPFGVEISSATKYGFLARQEGKLCLTELARRILRPTNPDDQLKAYREAVLNAPEISDVYKHYRGENLPDEEAFFRNTVVDTYHIPEADFPDFKTIFMESLEKAQLLQKHDDKTRVLDVSEEVIQPQEKSARIKKLGSEAAVKAGDTCFVMQPFALPHGDYYEKIFKPAIEKTKLVPVRADAEIFGGVDSPPYLIDDFSVHDPFWGAKLIEKVAENILSALTNPEEATFKANDSFVTHAS